MEDQALLTQVTTLKQVRHRRAKECCHQVPGDDWWSLEQDLRQWRDRTAKQVAAYQVEVGSLRGCVPCASLC